MTQDDAEQSRMEAFVNLSGFKRDMLYTLARLEEASDEPVNGLQIKDALEDLYGTNVNHGRLYPNLDSLDANGWIQKKARAVDERTNAYETTKKGRVALHEYASSVIDVFELPDE